MSEPYTPEVEAEYRRVLGQAGEQMGTNSALDILYRMGYRRAVCDHTRELARAADAQKRIAELEAELADIRAKLERAESALKSLRAMADAYIADVSNGSAIGLHTAMFATIEPATSDEIRQALAAQPPARKDGET